MAVGVVATSSAVPLVELEMGVEHLHRHGFDVRVHPQCQQQHFTFAGEDRARAGALYEYAADPDLEAIWIARGGYGATRLLPLLEELTAARGAPPRKLLIGYSDVTALHEFVRTRWGWATLHAPMPAVASFTALREQEWSATIACVRGERIAAPWESIPLQFITPPPAAAVRASLIGGNLSVWNCLTGTPYAFPIRRDVMLFLEDVGEAYYRIDRMITHLLQGGRLSNVRAVLLGDFTNCEDETPMVLAAPPDPAKAQPAEKKPLRKHYNRDEAFAEIFGTLAKRLGIPIAAGLPVGHGPNFHPLPLGAQYELRPDGRLRLLHWDWFGKH